VLPKNSSILRCPAVRRPHRPDRPFGVMPGRRGGKRQRHLSRDPHLVRVLDQALVDATKLGFPACLKRPLRDDGRESVAAVGSSCRYARTTNGDHAFPPAAGAQCRLVAGLLWAPRYGSGAGDYPPAACRNCGHDPGSVAHATGGGLASGSYLAWIVYAATLNAGIVTLNAAQELIHCPALGHVCQRARWVGTSVTRANRCSAEDPGVVSASPAGKALTSDGRSRLDLGRG